jgi:hypothetical protein
MAVSETSGKIYDVGEYGRLDTFIKEQQSEMDKIDLEKSVQTKKIIQYSIILVGVSASLFYFKYLVSKKK